MFGFVFHRIYNATVVHICNRHQHPHHYMVMTSQVPQPTQEVGWDFNALKSWKFFFRAFQNRQLAMYRAGW